MAYQIEWVPRGLHVTYSGETSDLEVAEFARIGQADSRFSELRFVLHDFSECTKATYCPERVMELAAVDSAAAVSNPNIHIVVVSARSDVLEMVKAYRDTGFRGFELTVVDNLAKAMHLLSQMGVSQRR